MLIQQMIDAACQDSIMTMSGLTHHLAGYGPFMNTNFHDIFLTCTLLIHSTVAVFYY